MTFKLFFRLALACCLFGSGLARAQPSNIKEARPHYFRALGWKMALSGIYYTASSKTSSLPADVELNVYESVRSIFYELPQGPKLELYQLQKDPTGKVTRTVVATVDLAGAGPTPLLIFSPDATQAIGWRVVVLPDDLTSFPAETCRFVNTTDAKIHVAFKTTILTISPHSMETTKVKDFTEGGVISIKMAASNQDKVQLIYTNTWSFPEHLRYLVFISVGSNGRAEVRRMADSTQLLPADMERLNPPAEASAATQTGK